MIEKRTVTTVSGIELKIGQRWLNRKEKRIYFISHIESDANDEYPIKCMVFPISDWEQCELECISPEWFRAWFLLEDGELVIKRT